MLRMMQQQHAEKLEEVLQAVAEDLSVRVSRTAKITPPAVAARLHEFCRLQLDVSRELNLLGKSRQAEPSSETIHSHAGPVGKEHMPATLQHVEQPVAARSLPKCSGEIPMSHASVTDTCRMNVRQAVNTVFQRMGIQTAAGHTASAISNTYRLTSSSASMVMDTQMPMAAPPSAQAVPDATAEASADAPFEISRESAAWPEYAPCSDSEVDISLPSSASSRNSWEMDLAWSQLDVIGNAHLSGTDAVGDLHRMKAAAAAVEHDSGLLPRGREVPRGCAVARRSERSQKLQAHMWSSRTYKV